MFCSNEFTIQAYLLVSANPSVFVYSNKFQCYYTTLYYTFSWFYVRVIFCNQSPISLKNPLK